MGGLSRMGEGREDVGKGARDQPRSPLLSPGVGTPAAAAAKAAAKAAQFGKCPPQPLPLCSQTPIREPCSHTLPVLGSGCPAPSGGKSPRGVTSWAF